MKRPHENDASVPPAPTAPLRLARRFALALALPACLTLSSCFTLGLWGFDYTCSDGDSSWEFDETEWDGEDDISWYGRLILTPFTLAADVATLCIQAWLFDDDDDDRPRRRRKGC